jgi:hypothetical protein
MEQNIKNRRPFVIVSVADGAMAFSLEEMYGLILNGFITVRWK